MVRVACAKMLSQPDGLSSMTLAFDIRRRANTTEQAALLQADISPAVGGQQRRVGGLEMSRATATHQIHEHLPRGSAEIVRRSELGAAAVFRLVENATAADDLRGMILLLDEALNRAL